MVFRLSSCCRFDNGLACATAGRVDSRGCGAIGFFDTGCCGDVWEAASGVIDSFEVAGEVSGEVDGTLSKDFSAHPSARKSEFPLDLTVVNF